MKFLFSLLFWIVVHHAITTSACKAQPQYPLSGQIELHPDWKPVVYLIQSRHFSEIAADYLGVVLDSAAITPEGHFYFQQISLPGEKSLATLVVQQKGNRFANHLIDAIPSEANYMPLVLAHNRSVVISAQISSFQNTFFIDQPSADHQAMIALRDKRIGAYARLKSERGEGIHADSLLMEEEGAYNRYTKVLRDFADSIRSLEAALVAIRWASPTGDFERMAEFLHSQCQKWQNVLPEHIFTAELCAVADKGVLPVMTGDIMPDFNMPLITGDTFMLSTLHGKRFTIIDIWASWCAPCRKENREILGALYYAYKDKGLQIIGYSI